MTSEEYIKLYQKYIAGKCNADEVRQLFDYKDGFRLIEAKETVEDEALKTKIRNRIAKEITATRTIKLWYKYAAAAIIIIAASVTFYLINKPDNNRKQDTVILKPYKKQMVLTDSSAVMLTLSNGSVISLNNAQNGLLTAEGASQINKTANNEVEYKAADNWDYMSATINKLYVPKGTQYKLTLSDGTKVWLNANSTLYYPSAFRGLERSVELSGEAYFEVAKNEKMPFIVKTKTTQTRVLGTHFNISAYNDDDFEKTTLAEGAVKVFKGQNTVLLKPGQQSIAENSHGEIAIKQADLQKVLAWKEGYFLFKEDNIRDVMKQIARWYNMDIVYQTTGDGKVFGGIYSKSKGVEELLKGLELTGLVKFKIEGRRIIVMD